MHAWRRRLVSRFAMPPRRARELARLARGAIAGASGQRTFSPVAWLMLGGWAATWPRPEWTGAHHLLAAALLLSLSLIALFDARYHVVPDIQVFLLSLLGAVNLALSESISISESLLAAAAAFAGMHGISLLYLRLRGRPGMGTGDAKLLAAGGGWIGLAGLPSCLLWGVASALASVAIMYLQGRSISRDLAIPFGTHLCLGIWLVWLFGPLDPFR